MTIWAGKKGGIDRREEKRERIEQKRETFKWNVYSHACGSVTLSKIKINDTPKGNP